MSKHVLLLASNPATSPVTGWPIGFWWAELSHSAHAFMEAGYDVTIASPEGGDLEGDGWSDPEHESGYSAGDLISLGYKHSPVTKDTIKDTPKLSTLNMDDYDAIFVAGGQGPMVTMIDDTAVHETLAAFHATGKPLCLVCHATCMLLKIRDADGDLLVKGRTWTGFADSEERYAEHAAGQKVQPFWIETEARKIEDTNFIVGGHLVPFAMRDGNLITGQQQVSAAAAAAKVIEALGR